MAPTSGGRCELPRIGTIVRFDLDGRRPNTIVPWIVSPSTAILVAENENCPRSRPIRAEGIAHLDRYGDRSDRTGSVEIRVGRPRFHADCRTAERAAVAKLQRGSTGSPRNSPTGSTPFLESRKPVSVNERASARMGP